MVNIAGSGSRTKEGRRQLAESEPSRQSRRVANLGVEPHRSLEDVERDARKANAERRKAVKEAKEVSAQEGVTSGSAVQDAHQVSKSGGQEMAPEGADVSMSADSKLGPDDEDKSVPDASAQASVGGANVVEPPVGGRVSRDDDAQFGPADDVEVVEVGSDPVDDDDEVELVKVEPAVKKELHLSTVQEDQVLEDMGVFTRKPYRTTSTRTPVQARIAPVSLSEVQVKSYVADQVRRWEGGVSERSFPPNIKYDLPQGHLDSTSYMSTILTTSEYLRKRASMAAQADAWIAEMELTRRALGAPGAWMTMAIPFERFSPRECVAVLQTQLFEAGFSFLNLVPGWFRTRANKAHPDLVRSVVEKMLILLNIEIAELSQLIAQAATAQVSTHVVLSRLEGGALYLDMELSNREAELLGRHYLRVLNVSGLQKSTSPRGLSPRNPCLHTHSRVWKAHHPAAGSEAMVKAESQASSKLFGMPNFSDESLVSATSASGTSRDSSSEYAGLGLDRDAGGHMLVVPMVMPGRTLGEDTPVGPATDLHVTHETHLRIPVEISQDDVAMSKPDQSHGRGRTSKTS
ncbi:unnamed protein product [Phytophthora fragariaefolia]|uniref:Unnamed protein product n=1 Tax=Phytophthora fragariaefolia TaxID=1490495 RepID=A0A9W7D125_9STRA|nr:unnamed protein product [Phytophthora fragariaefolia]